MGFPSEYLRHSPRAVESGLEQLTGVQRPSGMTHPRHRQLINSINNQYYIRQVNATDDNPLLDYQSCMKHCHLCLELE